MEKKYLDLIEKVSYIEPSKIAGDESNGCYYSKFDGSYLGREGMEDDGCFNMLLKYGITDQLQSPYKDAKVVALGFSPKEQKWYGWSHRAIYGFEIGSKCKKGECHYQADTKENFLEDCRNFWNDKEHHKWTKAKEITETETKELGVLVEWEYNDKIKNKQLHNTINGHFTPYPKTWGKGEWVAKTMEDAKQMAIDFAEGVS